MRKLSDRIYVTQTAQHEKKYAILSLHPSPIIGTRLWAKADIGSELTPEFFRDYLAIEDCDELHNLYDHGGRLPFQRFYTMGGDYAYDVFDCPWSPGSAIVLSEFKHYRPEDCILDSGEKGLIWNVIDENDTAYSIAYKLTSHRKDYAEQRVRKEIFKIRNWKI
ncbi:MAG: hypothetical protein GY861_20290 [bacterium]|nr:hypothetical protein [bacterium]